MEGSLFSEIPSVHRKRSLSDTSRILTPDPVTTSIGGQANWLSSRRGRRESREAVDTGRWTDETRSSDEPRQTTDLSLGGRFSGQVLLFRPPSPGLFSISPGPGVGREPRRLFGTLYG